MGAKLVIVHVEEPPAAYGTGEMYYGIPDPDMPALTKMLEAVVPGDPQVPYEHHMATGDPAGEIVSFAEKEKVDLIVMGTHGRTGLGRLLMGSVAEAVVRRAPCPVFTFKESKPAKAYAHLWCGRLACNNRETMAAGLLRLMRR